MSVAIAVAIGLPLAALAVAAWAVFIEPRRFRVRRVVLDADELGLPPLRILHVTDTHFHGRDGAMLRFLADLARGESFDAVFWTGDLIDTPGGIPSIAEAARLFSPRLGSFAVLGGHDYAWHGAAEAYLRLLSGSPAFGFSRDNPVDELRGALESAGVHLLEDESRRVEAGAGRGFAVVGLRDAFVIPPDYDAAWRGVQDGAPVVVLAHSPDVLRETASRGARVAFCGHTHGGQVRFPLIGALVTRSDLPGRLASGVFRAGPTTFLLNNGLGVSPATPFRLLCRPEVTVAQIVTGAAPKDLTVVEEA